MSTKRARIKSNEAESSSASIHVFYNTLSPPLQKILKKIDKALESDNSKVEWPSEKEFVIAEKILIRIGNSTKAYLKEIFLPAWEKARKTMKNPTVGQSSSHPVETMSFAKLVECYGTNKSQNITGRSLTMRVVQRWGISKNEFPSAPACFLMKQDDISSVFIVMKVFSSNRSGRGYTNYRILAGMPLGAEIRISDFQISAMRVDMMINNFISISQEFEIHASNACISILDPESQPKMKTLSLVQLHFVCLKTSVEAEVKVLTSREFIRSSGEEVDQFVAWSGNRVKRWTVDVYDMEGSLAKLTLWDKEEIVQMFKKFADTPKDITVNITVPSSIKVIDGDLVVAANVATMIKLSQ